MKKREYILIFLVAGGILVSLGLMWAGVGNERARGGVEAADKPNGAIGAPSADPFRGKPFSDPAKVFDMPAEWKKQPIKYESWAGGADLAVALDQQIYQAVLPLVREFEKRNGLKIAVEEGTCGTSAGALQRKSVDVSAMCCAPGEADRLPGLRYHTIGISSLAIIVNKSNTIKNIDMASLRNLFRGKIHNWQELKSPSGAPVPVFTAAVKPVVRLHCKARPGHWCLLLAKEEYFGKNVLEVGSILDMLKQVASLTGGAGYETLWMLENYAMKDKLGVLDVDGHSPYDHQSVLSSGYSMYRTMNLTTWDDPKIAKPQAKKLVEYIMSNLDRIDPVYEIIPAPQLKKAGWKFTGDELTGEPF